MASPAAAALNREAPMPKKPPPEVQAYLSKLPGDRRRTLVEIRNALLRANSALIESLNPWGYMTFATPR